MYSHPSERRYHRIADLPEPDKSRLLHRLYRLAGYAARDFAGPQCSPYLEVTVDVATDLFLALRCYRLPTALTYAQLTQWAERCLRKQCRRALARYQKRCRRLLSLDDLTASLDGGLPPARGSEPWQADSWNDFEQLLANLGVHADWRRFIWDVAVERYSWTEMARMYGDSLSESTCVLRKRWSRLTEDLRPLFTANRDGISTSALRLPPTHWAAQPMRRAARRSADAAKRGR